VTGPPQWKVDLFKNRERHPSCRCGQEEDGTPILRSRCPHHGWEGDPDAESGRELAELDALRQEHE
jgi:hypothetical protein